MSNTLKVAEAKEIYLTDREMWKHTQRFFMHSTHTTSYKFVLMKALLESISDISKKDIIEFKQITRYVVSIYWNLVIRHGLNQLNSTRTKSKIEQILLTYQKDNNIPSNWSFEKLVEIQQLELVQLVLPEYKKYVFGSFYGAFDGTIYSFNKKKEWLQLAKPYVDFFFRYKKILMDLTNYHMTIFLAKHNSEESIENLLTKIQFLSVRESLKEFQKILINTGVKECFYCKKSLKKIHVDHFIPWSYVQNDVLWNFVLTCPSCNASKSNKIAHSRYLEDLIERNQLIVHEKMESYEIDKLKTMYEYAIYNGFQSEWEPNLINN